MADFIDPLTDPEFRRSLTTSRPATPLPEGFVDPLADPAFRGSLRPTVPQQAAKPPNLPWHSFATGEGRRQFDFPDLLAMLPTPREGAGGLPNLGALFGDQKPIQAEGKLPITAGQADSLKNALALGQDPQQMMDVIQKVLPGATFTQDQFGNPIVTYDGQSAYLNRPGFSGQDLATGSTMAATGVLAISPMMAPLARWKLPARMAAVGVGTGAASAVQDLALHGMGAEKAIDLPRVGTMAALGAAFEPAANVIGAIYRTVVRTPALYDAVLKRLTPQGVEKLRAAGVDPAQISDEYAQMFAQQAENAVEPNVAARFASGQTNPVKIPFTRGQMTMRASDQMFEDQALKGSFGEDAASKIRGFVGPGGIQQTAIRENVPAIQNMLGGGTVREAGDGAAALQRELLARRQSANAAVDVAYDKARDTSAGIMFPAVRDGAFNIERKIAGDFDLKGLPRVQSLLDDLKAFAPPDGADGATTVRALFDWRKRASAARFGAGTPEEQAALGRAIAAFDEWIDDAAKNGLMGGDAEAVSMWKEAIRLRREFGKDFEGGDLIEDLTKSIYRSGERQLKVDPVDAANYILNAGPTGWVSRTNLNRDLTRIRDMLGADSTAWNGIREEVFLRLARTLEGQLEGNVRMASGANFLKAWQKAQLENPGILRILFNDSERRIIGQFAADASAATTPVRGGQNFSNTTSALANLIGRFFNSPRIGNLLKEGQLFLGPAYRGTQNIRAHNATNFAPRSSAGYPAGTGVIGAYGTNSQLQ